MNKHQQTAYGIETLIYRLFGLPPIIDPYTTINERLSIMGDSRPTDTEPVTMSVLIAGNKGHKFAPGVQGIPLIGVVDHMATDASLYGPLPLALRPMDEDLSPTARTRYCLRKVLEHNGTNYYAYYGLRLPIGRDNISVQKVKVTRSDQGVTEEPFIPSNDNLFPEPPTLPDSGGITASDVSVRVNALLRVTLSASDIKEFVEAVKVLYDGDERYAVISEFGLCTGANRVVETSSTGGTINFTESIGTCVYAFTMEHKALFYNTQELSIDFDLGNQIPLFTKQSIPTMNVIP